MVKSKRDLPVSRNVNHVEQPSQLLSDYDRVMTPVIVQHKVRSLNTMFESSCYPIKEHIEVLLVC